jgi:hypothetical protein
MERVRVQVVREERYWYPDGGGQVWLAGFQLVGDDGAYLARDAPPVLARGLRTAGVAGARRFHPEALDGDAAAPGMPLGLRRDAENPHDPNAVAVEAGRLDLGFVPRELAGEVAASLDAGTPWSAVVLREQRPSPREPRTGVTMLLAPAAAIELVEVAAG